MRKRNTVSNKLVNTEKRALFGEKFKQIPKIGLLFIVTYIALVIISISTCNLFVIFLISSFPLLVAFQIREDFFAEVVELKDVSNENETTEYKTTIASLKQEKYISLDKIKKISIERDDLQNEVDRLRFRLSNADPASNSDSSSIEWLKKQLSVTSEGFAKQNETFKRLKEDFDLVTEQKNKLEEIKQENSQQNEKLSKEIDHYKQMVSKYKNQLSKLNLDYRDLKTENAKMSSLVSENQVITNEKLRAQQQTLNKQVTSAEKEGELIERNLKKVYDEKKGLAKQLSLAEDIISTHRKEMNELEDRYRKLELSNEDTLREMGITELAKLNLTAELNKVNNTLLTIEASVKKREENKYLNRMLIVEDKLLDTELRLQGIINERDEISKRMEKLKDDSMKRENDLKRETVVLKLQLHKMHDIHN